MTHLTGHFLCVKIHTRAGRAVPSSLVSKWYNISMPNINVDGQTWSLPPRKVSQAVYGLVKVWETLGKPNNPVSNTGIKMMANIIDCWIKFFPEEAKQWSQDRNQDLLNERDARASIKAGGYNPVTYPPTLYKMMKVIFREVKLTDKKVLAGLYKNFAVFRTSKYAPSTGGKDSVL